jgi:hypothetical protein
MSKLSVRVNVDKPPQVYVLEVCPLSVCLLSVFFVEVKNGSKIVT